MELMSLSSPLYSPRIISSIPSSYSLKFHPSTLKPSLLNPIRQNPIPPLHLSSTPRNSSRTLAAAAMRSDNRDVPGLLLRERIVFLGNEIDDYVADAIASQLLMLDAQDHTKDIKLFINCPGGSLSSAMGIFDVIQLIRADVSTIAIGISASTASIILGGGTKSKRYAMPNARIMMHQPLGGTNGYALDVNIQAQELQANKTNVIRIISEFSGRSPEQVEKDIDRDRYMSPIEALEYGLIDGIIDKDGIIPLVPVLEKV